MNKKKRTGYNPLDDLLPQIQDTREDKEAKNKQRTSKSASKSTSNFTSTSESTSTSKNTIKNNGASTITITRKAGEDYIKMTHYFRPDQLKALDRLHKKSGRDKSELVRMAIDILIERAQVE